MIEIIKSKIRKFFLLSSGQFKYLRITVSVNKKWYGNQYGGFYVCPDLLDQNSIVYSFGIGEDVSFDVLMIKNHNCRVFGFDPTPKSINWVKKQSDTLSSNFIFYEYGIGEKCGIVDFFLPKNNKHVSGSFVIQKYVDDNQTITVELKSFAVITDELGHNQIDVLKMDIEGGEYTVLEGILNSPIQINQILVEFHDRFFEDGKLKTINCINILHSYGYEIFAISDTFEEISFIYKDYAKNL
ncbi:FkbM family methyltransferase [Desulfococcaceae bacterium HSG7]|nr:FkbM family methyltransferase [Desulfococcaceae bacterium HSG7]